LDNPSESSAHQPNEEKVEHGVDACRDPQVKIVHISVDRKIAKHSREHDGENSGSRNSRLRKQPMLEADRKQRGKYSDCKCNKQGPT